MSLFNFLALSILVSNSALATSEFDSIVADYKSTASYTAEQLTFEGMPIKPFRFLRTNNSR